ncbi:MAG: hypothetical protein FGF52_06675 [Candidatus Brockarchaeota archaeon]|nr:hypothetical protein [Candidatus Brockarchaeota archaeon]
MVAIILGGVFIFLSISFGIAVSMLLRIILTLEERICLSIIVGHATSAMIMYFLSYLQGELNFLTIGIGILFIIFVTLFIMARRKTAIKRSMVFNVERVFIILFGLIAFTSLNLQCVLREAAGSLYGSSFVVGDYCFHIAVINSFVFRNNFPPKYPVMVNIPMKYPPLVDFLSSILMKTGFDLRSSIIIPNILFQVSLLCLISSLATRVFGRKYVGIVSSLLFFFSGNMGVIYAVQDALRHDSFIKWVSSLPEDYSGSGVSNLQLIRFGNPIIVMLMPQRPSMLGIGISLVIYILMTYSIREEENKRELLLAGVLNGFLPSIHPHSFIAVSLVLFFLAIFFKKIGFFVYLFAPAVVLALPQIFTIRTQVGEGFISPVIGWLEENTKEIVALDWNISSSIFISTFKSILIIVYFWFMNIGVISILTLIGFLSSNRNIKIFYLPYLLLFLIGNFVRFQPWDWDNYKVFIHWYIFTITLAAYGVLEIAKFSYIKLKKDVYFRFRIIGILTLAGLVTILLLSTASGFLSHLKVFQENYLMWPRSDIVFAEWIRENTPQESVFLTSTHFLNPIVTLAGKQIVLGYEGWLWSHGLNWTHIQKVKNDVIEMFRGNYTLIKKYNVSYIVITRYEHIFASDNNFIINIDFFNESHMFKKVYDKTINGSRYLVFKVL